MKAYSEDLRKKIVDAVTEHGTKESEASYAFRASFFFVKRYVRLVEVGKPLIPKKKRVSLPKIDQTARRLLEEELNERPAVSLKEPCKNLGSAVGLVISSSPVRRMIKCFGYTRKKNSERLKTRQMVESRLKNDDHKKLDTKRIIFVDECGPNASLAPQYVYCPKGAEPT
jgi:transposase